MRRFYLLIVLCLLISGATMAQFAQHKNTQLKSIDGISSVVKIQQNTKTEPIWKCDFEEGCPEYVLAKADGYDIDWQIVSEATFPELMFTSSGCYFYPMNYSGREGLSQEPQQISETPGHWALLDIGSDNYLSPVAADATITFSGIDLSSCQFPKVSFMQSYKELNSASDFMIIQTSTDGGATWTDHEVNDEEIPDKSYKNGLVEVLIPEVGNQSNVTLRFHYQNLDGIYNGIAWNYGWQIDDIKIIDVPQNNVTLANARMNMFGYYDYTDPEVLSAYFSNYEDPRAAAYQRSDPYGQTPRSNWVNAESEWQGTIVFNMEVINNGNNTVTPKARITVTSPSNDVIFDRTLSGISMAMGTRDTIDFYTADEDIFYFNVTSPEQIEIGKYTVDYSVFIEGADDPVADNTRQDFFYITENNYSLAYDEPTAKFGMCDYTNSASGDEIGEYFYYFYIPEEELNVDIFIANGTTTGSSFVVTLYENGDEDFIPMAVSNSTRVTEDMVGTWQTISFQDAYNIDAFDENYKSKSLFVSVKMYYDIEDEDKFYLGKNNELSTFGHRAIARYAGSEDWYYGYGALAIRIHEKNETAVESVSMNGINMYPNPSNGIVNFSNVENATIEVYNMMGQVVASESNVNDNASIDLSGVANGNYIVRIVKNDEIATSKLSIVK
ncbi:MAG: T9SS type A sorting domain-containing protein [Bacteroidales bacterium]|nr:T9SS type A sorting domain-containing protein [Bacteroidales bacterium]